MFNGFATQITYENSIWEIASNYQDFSVAGTNSLSMFTGSVVFNNSGKDYDFKIKGDADTNLFFVDASVDRIGIGTASPDYKLHVVGTVSTTGFRMTNGASSGYLLQSDSSGNATWISATTSSANFANTNLTFTGNRTHNTNGNSFELTTDNGGFAAGFIYFNNIQKAEYGFGTSYTDWRTLSVDHYLSGVKRLEILSTETVFNNPGGNYDFRVEGDADTNLLFVDASNDNIGIGTSGFSNVKLNLNTTKTSHIFGLSILSNTGTGTYNYGLLSSAESTGVQYNIALEARASGGTSENYGLYGRSSGTSSINKSIFGEAITNNTSTNYAIYLNAINTGGGSAYALLSDAGDVVFNESGGNYDFRIEGLTESNLFFVDASNDNIGIGTASPNYKLEVLGTVSTTGFRMTNGASNSYILTSDASGNATWTSSTTVSANLGRILYVSGGGSNSTAEVGNITKPFATIIAAKDISVSGDTIYVMPQTITYSNTSALSYPYNGVVNTLVNLWKDDITYYFSPGTKIIFYNETPSGSDMYLFRPTGGTAATCKVFGELEFEQNGVGADSSNGVNNYFYGTPIGTDLGYTFYSETKLLKSNHCQVIDIRRTSSTGTARVTIISQEEEWNYVSGQSAVGSFYFINNNATSVLEFTANVKIRRYNAYFPWYFNTNSNASDKINFLGNDIYNTGNNLFILRSTSTTINCHLDKIYYTTAYTPFGYWGSIVSTFASGGWKLNLKADLIDLAANSLTTGMFYLTTSGNTLNFDGNITTNTISGAGRFIAATTTTNTININGDINILGTSSTTNVLFQSLGGSVINYKGKISGNYIGPVVKTYTGTVNINNSVITSTVDGSTSQIFINGATTLGTCKINNSYVELKNSTVGITDGSYVKALINNSTIVNSGTSSVGMSNTTDFGILQLSNSVVISGATSISYTGTASVIGVNSTVNATYSISDLKGSLPILTDLIY